MAWLPKICCTTGLFSDKIINVYIYIHIYIDFLPDLEYIMKNRTEQNRTEQR